MPGAFSNWFLAPRERKQSNNKQTNLTRQIRVTIIFCDTNLIGQTEGSGMTSSKFDESKGPSENGGSI